MRINSDSRSNPDSDSGSDSGSDSDRPCTQLYSEVRGMSPFVALSLVASQAANQAAKSSASPLPCRVTTGISSSKLMTVVGSSPQ